ncbi:MAG TPA: type II toxin-antitoxin system VapC family toxin [Thermoanaerobaculia bacterium]
MILYLDTSSLIKLFIDETHCDLVRSWADQAAVLCSSRVAYPEAMSAIARRWRAEDLDDEEFRLLRQALAEQWQDFVVVNLDEVAAGDLAVEHGLRGFDAVHLAAALGFLSRAGSVAVFFSSFDDRLNRAARSEGLVVLGADSGQSLAMP